VPADVGYVLGGTNYYRGIVDPAGNFTGWHFSTDGGRCRLSGRDVDEVPAVAPIGRRVVETVAPDPGDALAPKCREDP